MPASTMRGACAGGRPLLTAALASLLLHAALLLAGVLSMRGDGASGGSPGRARPLQVALRAAAVPSPARPRAHGEAAVPVAVAPAAVPASAEDGGRTDGGRTDGGRTDGGRTDGGRTDGGDAAAAAEDFASAATPHEDAALPAPLYFVHAELDVPPYPLDELPELPEPPVVGPAGDVAGRLVVAVWIDDRGQPVRVETQETSLPAALAAQMAEAVLRQRFSPAIRHGWRVPALVRAELHYAPPPVRAALRR